MSRRIDRDDLVNPTVLGHDNIGNDWHVRLGTTAGKPFTFVTPTEAAAVAAAWFALAMNLVEREEWTTLRADDLVAHVVTEMRLQAPNLARLLAEQDPEATCTCGEPDTPNVVHRYPAPCYHEERT